VKVPKVSSLRLEQWVAEHERLKRLNEEIRLGTVGKEPSKAKVGGIRPRKKR
jgi:hypothetical protein